MSTGEFLASPRSSRRWLWPSLEVVVAFLAAGLLTFSCTNIKVDPLVRIGQVSGLASIQLRFILFVLPLLAALLVAAKLRGGIYFARTSRLVCAALAGLASGFLAGGLIVALRGTPFCLNATGGDAGVLVSWANAIKAGVGDQYVPPLYPPAFPHALRWYMDIVDLPAVYALKHLQILGALVAGPAGYLAWRLVLRPSWALVIGVVPAMVIVEPYKPYTNVVLIVLVPVLIRFFNTLRTADRRSVHQLLKAGVVFGLVLGAMCLTYSGWFRWSAPGLVVAGLIVFPWRRAPRRGIAFGVAAMLALGAVTFNYVTGVRSYAQQRAAADSKPLVLDDYIYFDVLTEPAYIAMWKVDLPGKTTEWPPDGELGGVGLYSVLLCAGLGIAIMLGHRRTPVITVACLFAGAWLMRFWYAHLLFKTKLVQLYPRTTIELVYCLLVLLGFAAYYLIERIASRADEKHPVRQRSALIGAWCALAFLFGQMGSSISERYMPEDGFPFSTGYLAWQAHQALKAPAPSP
ncbi:MAG: hypothetical protein HOV81_03285 [Kofleriaceae bacterium]|nr:hypothetical protein [Kofleriaceae bacterium]